LSDKEIKIEKKWLQLSRLDHSEFVRLYEKYLERVYRYISARTKSPETAEDLTSETFVIALENLDKFRWRGYTFGAWLFKIAVNLIYQENRLAGRHQPLDEAFGLHLRVLGRDPLNELCKSEQSRFLMKCMEQLDEQSRKIMELHYWADLKVREIAVVLDMPEGTVQSKLKRGRDRIAAIEKKRVMDLEMRNEA
jgi:RNA polymerase sigma-70 factor, ECF subfamily